MNSQLIRTFTIAMLLFGCVALAVPQVSQQLENWLLDSPRAPQQTHEQAVRLTQDDRLPVRSEFRTNTNVAHGSRQTPAPVSRGNTEFAFGYEADFQDSRNYSVQRSALERPLVTHQEELIFWQHELERHGAKFVVVEELGNHYQCRCILPVATNSTYEKVFAAEATEPALAMREVLEQVKLQSYSVEKIVEPPQPRFP